MVLGITLWVLKRPRFLQPRRLWGGSPRGIVHPRRLRNITECILDRYRIHLSPWNPRFVRLCDSRRIGTIVEKIRFPATTREGALWLVDIKKIWDFVLSRSSPRAGGLLDVHPIHALPGASAVTDVIRHRISGRESSSSSTVRDERLTARVPGREVVRILSIRPRMVSPSPPRAPCIVTNGYCSDFRGETVGLSHWGFLNGSQAEVNTLSYQDVP